MTRGSLLPTHNGVTRPRMSQETTPTIEHLHGTVSEPSGIRCDVADGKVPTVTGGDIAFLRAIQRINGASLSASSPPLRDDAAEKDW